MVAKPITNRNSPCSCSSGKRYKHCCGILEGNPSFEEEPNARSYRSLMFDALRCQQANNLEQAEDLYRQVLNEVPDEPDCLHMLGVICMQTNRYLEAVRLIKQSAELMDWRVPAIVHNLKLALSHALREADSAKSGYTLAKSLAYRIWQKSRASTEVSRLPLVSVIVPSYNHARYIANCLRSVYEQTYRQIELIIVDDGSKDGSPQLIDHLLKDCPFPYHWVARENRGAHATINEAVDLATGEYINVLNSDDQFSLDRIGHMVNAVAFARADWGFSNVQIIDELGFPVRSPLPGSRAATLESILFEGPRTVTLGFGLLKSNFAITSGNFFISRAFLIRLGGFSNLRYNHDWEFALRATLESEPIYVTDKLYSYRLHDYNTIAESSTGPQQEAAALFEKFFKTNIHPPNSFSPCRAYWGSLYLAEELRWLADFGFGHESLSLLSSKLLTDDIPQQELPTLSSMEILREQPNTARILDFIAENNASDAISFDQVQCHGVTAMAIEAIRQPGQTFRILVVGDNGHRMLGKFLHGDRIVYLDHEIPEEINSDQDAIFGDTTSPDFQDAAFDIVVALDVLEHLPPQKRRDFLSQINRMARCMTIIAAPFNSPHVRAAEAEVRAYWNELMPTPYRGLPEHAEHGLPDLDAMQTVLTELGIRFWSIGHGNLNLWREMQKGNLTSEAWPALKPALNALVEFYRKQALAQDFSKVDCYRTFLFCPSPHDLGSFPERKMENFLQSLPDTHYSGMPAMLSVLQAMQELAMSRVSHRVRN